MKDVLNLRTRHLAVVLEDIHQTHNASAVLRSCDCFGIQDIYTIEENNFIRISEGVTRNSHKWLTLHRYQSHKRKSKKDCYDDLVNKGYKIAATVPYNSSISLYDLPLEEPLALFFGSEKEGLSYETLNAADYLVGIPMFGFSESLNLSVSAAICLNYLGQKLRSELADEKWELNEFEKKELYIEWLKKSVRASDKILANYSDALKD